MVRVWVDTVPVSVLNSEGKVIVCQISPHFTDQETISNDVFKVETSAHHDDKCRTDLDLE